MSVSLLPILDLTIIGVADPGVPNKERVVIRPLQTVNLGEFAVGIGLRNATDHNLVVPLQDFVFWLPSKIIEAPAWVLLYTGFGKATTEATTAGQPQYIYTYHWGRSVTVFNYKNIVPILWRLSEMFIGPDISGKPDYLLQQNAPPLPPLNRPAGDR